MNVSEYSPVASSILPYTYARSFLSTIIDIWKSLVSGLPIDEQKLMRAAKSQTVLKEDEPPSASSEAQALRDPDDSDDERDPNDAPFVSMPAASGSSYVDPYLDMDDDEPEDW